MAGHKKITLSIEYLIFATIILLVSLAAALWITFSDYQFLKKERISRYRSEAEKAATAINQTFKNINSFIEFASEVISENDKYDAVSIAEILTSKVEINKLRGKRINPIIVDYIDPKGYLIASSKEGALPNALKLSKNMPQLELTKTHPWIMQVGSPEQGITSAENIIPFRYGITDINGKYIGALSIELQLTRLNEIIQDYLSDNNTSFIVVNEANDLITKHPGEADQVSSLIFNRNDLDNKEGMLSTAYIAGNIEYQYYKKIFPYNYTILIGSPVNVIKAEFASVVIPQLYKTTLLGLVFVVLLFFFGKKIVEPMVILSRKALMIAEGNFDIDIPRLQSTEANNLANALFLVKEAFKKEQAVSLKLVETKKKLEASIYKLSRLQYELKQNNEQLEQKVKQRTYDLEQALKIKTEFLNNVSHEVRTPIQGVTALSQGLVEHWQDFSEPKRFNIAEKVAENANRLFSLVNNILDISKYNSGTLLLDWHKVDLVVLVKEMIEECQNLYLKEKPITLSYSGQELSAYAVVDKEKISQLLRNLMVNAIKFTAKGNISIILTREEHVLIGGKSSECWHLALRDQGKGIPKEELELIFQPFIQSSYTKSKAGGTGLGLTICKQIVESHQGKIWVENNPDQGATFHVIMPANLTQTYTETVAEPMLDTTNNTEKPINVLAIDDEESCLMSLGILLYGKKYNLTTVSSGEEGLRIINDHPEQIDLILLDLMMPGINGLNVLEQIRKNPSLSKIPVILQSGVSDEEEIKKAFELGIAESIRKPYQKNTIIATIEKVLYH